MDTGKRRCSLSIDLDNEWSYLKTHGDAGWEEFPSYLDIAVPRVIDCCNELGIKMTFFVVGQDAALEKNHAALRKIPQAGHEVANHSFHHEPWLHLYDTEKLRAEIRSAEEAIYRATGVRPVGFRGPGFSLSAETLRVLAEFGYEYDCSTWPTFIGPLARFYYRSSTKLTPEEEEQRRKLFGSFHDVLRPLTPYRWAGLAPLVEVPVSTMPIFRLPIHLSYLFYLKGYSERLALFYFEVVLLMCRLTGLEPSILLHSLDFLGGDDTRRLAFFPAMRMNGREKVAFSMKILRRLVTEFRIVTMREHVSGAGSDLPVREPAFG